MEHPKGVGLERFVFSAHLKRENFFRIFLWNDFLIRSLPIAKKEQPTVQIYGDKTETDKKCRQALSHIKKHLSKKIVN